MLDAALDYIKNNCTAMTACSAQPTTYEEATSTYALADVVMSDADFTHGAGDTSGRKTTVSSKNTVDIDVGGNANHVALVRTSASLLMYVTTCTTQALVSSGTVDFPSWDIEILDAA